MKTVLIALALLTPAALLIPAAAQAQTSRESNITGKKLVEVCSSKDRVLLEACTAYIDGISDSSAVYQRVLPQDGSKGGKLPAYFCVPSATTGVQMRQTVVDWIRKHADIADRQAGSLVLRSLNDTYLCPGEKPAQ